MAITGSGQSTNVRSLLFGHKWGSATVGTGATISYSYDLDEWATDPVTWAYESVGLTGVTFSDPDKLSPEYQSAVDRAFTLWKNVANLTINHDDSLGDNTSIVLRMGESSVDDGNAMPFYDVSGNIVPITTTGRPVPDQVVRDDILFEDDDENNANPGTIMSRIITHEIGHALGLKHQDDQGGQDPGSYVTSGLSQTESIMSTTSTDVMPITPMVEDIAAIQYLYGKNSTYNNGNTTYNMDGTQSYDGGNYTDFTANLSGTGRTYVGETIWDAGGTDTIDASSYGSGAVIDLRPGENGALAGQTWFFVAYHADIENAKGGSGIDHIDGNDPTTLDGQYAAFSGNNLLEGNGGNDVIGGHGGNDTLIGGAGGDDLDGGDDTDTLSYAGSSSAVTVDISGNTASGGDAASDTISNFENIIGSSYADSLTGTANANSITGGAGDDTLLGGGGADTLDGGANDSDTLSYLGSVAGAVTININTNSASGGDAASDVISNFENIIGSTGNDTLTGNASDNVIEGGAGGDSLTGGNGNDTLSYAHSSAGVTINFSSSSASGGDAASDTYAGFENILGSGSSDSLTGNSSTNVIEGGAAGDTLDGGSGTDTLSYEHSAAGVTVDLSNSTASNGDAASDTISNFENLTGSNNADTLTGSSIGNVLSGGLGNDTLDGKGGHDTLGGGDGNDTFDGGDGNDSLTGALGNDSLFGGANSDTLLGGDGNDTLRGGNGVDRMTGGSDADTFLELFLSGSGVGAGNRDIITDFLAGTDIIDISALKQLATDVFIGTGNFSGGGTQAETRYFGSGGDTVVALDSDGNGAADWQIQLTGNYTLQGTDFLL